MTAQPTLPAVEPKPPRRMKRPRKAWLYSQVEKLTAENERLRVENDNLADALGREVNGPTFMGEPVLHQSNEPPAPWWRRLIGRTK